MKWTTRATLVAASTLCLAATSQAAPLYSENFDVDPTASWTVNDSGLSDILVDFNYDYSAIGVPAAPGGATTRGLKMTANNSGGVFSGFSVSPTGKSFSGNYKLEFDMWQNYVGPLGPGGSGTTQLSLYGIGTAGTVPIWAGSSPKESVAFGTTLDGGSASDYRAYSSAAPTSYASGNAVYLSTGSTINNSDAYYSVFTGQTAPAAQVSSFAGQTGTTDAGETSFKWRHVMIDVSGGFATWSIDGLPLAKVDLSTVTLGGGNVFFGHSDTNAGSSADPNRTLLNVTIIDNVEVVPEPGSLALCAFGAIGALAASRRRR
jgi:PEP-CTERM motif